MKSKDGYRPGADRLLKAGHAFNHAELKLLIQTQAVFCNRLETRSSLV